MGSIWPLKRLREGDGGFQGVAYTWERVFRMQCIERSRKRQAWKASAKPSLRKEPKKKGLHNFFEKKTGKSECAVTVVVNLASNVKVIVFGKVKVIVLIDGHTPVLHWQLLHFLCVKTF